MITFQIQNDEGTFLTVSHNEFFEALNNGGCYRYYHQGGKHLAMQPTVKNEEILRVYHELEDAEKVSHFSEQRCKDEKGRPCRFQHNANGQVIRNDKGYAVRAKCGDCPRNGWQMGKRENCCIRNYCKTLDCAFCHNPREFSVPLSLDWLEENSYGSGENDGIGFHFADPNSDFSVDLEKQEVASALRIAINCLSSAEQAVIKALYWDKLSQRAYATKNGISRSVVKRRYDRALETLKNILKDFL